MYDMQAARLIKRISMDAVLWYCIPSVFLFIYVHYHAVSSDAIGPHLYLVLIGLLGLIVMRFAVHRWIHNVRVARAVASCAISAVLMAMLLYYALVLIGLGSWARVISWDLITSYAVQLPALVDSIGLSVHALGALFIVAYVALTYATYAYIKRFDWTSDLLPAMSGWMHLLVVTAGSAVCIIAVYHFALSPPIQKSEPIALTFFPMATARNLQGHAIDIMAAEKLDRLDGTVRSMYVANRNGAHKKNLILIVVDALRPDHMGIYGYQRNTTPNIARLVEAGRARVVRSVRASCGESSCGLLSLASSKYVHQLSNKPFTLQQVLQRHGYRVQMILGGDHTSFYGLKELYGEVDSYFDGSMARGYYVNDDQLVLDYTGRLPSWDGKPIMMQFHLMSTHVMGKRHDRFAKYAPSENYILPVNRSTMNNEKLNNFYDNGVVQADAYIHELLASLQSKGYLEDALVVITADHGEALGEHGLYAHANSVREEALRIPLIFISYGYQASHRIDSRVATSQVDIAPTILAEFGFPIPATWSGTPMQRPQGRDYSYFQEGQAAGLIDHRDPQTVWKYWFDAQSGNEYAYNLMLDPGEKNNAIDQVAASLKREWRLQQLQLMPGVQAASHLRRDWESHQIQLVPDM